jgi:hypothetical protein
MSSREKLNNLLGKLYPDRCGDLNVLKICSKCSHIKKMLYQDKNKDRSYQPDEFINAPIGEPDAREHIWFRIVDALEDRPLLCRVDSMPITEGVNYNDFMTVERSDVEEWLPAEFTEEEFYEYTYAVFKELADYVKQNPHEHE